jgi:3-hydroxyisobutyrate dehydrogenase-like beta-hydroxyacid dehydrogenase
MRIGDVQSGERAAKVGVIGLGTMGREIAANLLRAGYDLVVSDVLEEAGRPLVDEGAGWAASPSALAEQVEVVLTSLPGPREVEEVLVGTGGVLEGLPAGGAVFDLSTNSHRVVVELATRFAEAGRSFLDAPVSGGPRGARTGELAIWVGGDREVFDRYEPLLLVIGDEPRHLGAVGHATIAKLVHNTCSNTVRAALAEAFTMGVKAGVDPLTLWSALRHGSNGRARTFDRLADRFLTGEYDPPGFALRLAYKDVSLAMELGRDVEVPMRISQLVQAEMLEALNRGWADRDVQTPTLLQVERAGVDLRVPAEDIQAVLDADP